MGNKKESRGKTRLSNIFQIYRRDWKNILHNPVALLIVVGLLVLPSLYAWVNLVACWDPYGNTNGIKVAVVNLDKGVTLEGNAINAGDEIVKNLQGNDAIGWQFVEEDDAEYGLTHDRYYAMLEIPEDFTKQLVNVLDGDYQKPQIIYRVNEKSNAIAPKITDTGAKTVTNEVSKAILEVVDKVVFSMGNDMGQGLESNESKIKRLRDVVLTVNVNFNELVAELEKAQEGLATVEELLETANESVPLMEDGIHQLKDFSARSDALLGDAEQFRADGVAYIGDKFDQCQQLVDETRALLQETRTKLNSTEDLVRDVPPLLEKAEALQAALEDVLRWLEQQDIQEPDYDKWLQLLQSAENAAEKLVDVLQRLEQDPEQVQQVIVVMYDTADVALQKQETALKLVEMELQALLEAAQTEEERTFLTQKIEQTQQAQAALQQTIADNQSKREAVAAMAPEEVAAKIDSIVQEVTQAQAKVQAVEALVQKLQNSGISVETILQDLRDVDSLLGRGIEQVRSLLETADKAFVLSDEILDTAEETLDEIERAMQEITAQYENRWADMLDGIFADLYQTLDDLNEALERADGAVPKISDLLQQASDTETKGADFLAQLNKAVPEAKAELARLSQIMNKFSDSNLDTLISLLENDTDAAADYFSGPVELKEERLYHMDNYGTAMAPFYTILSLWVGCLLLSAVLTTEAKPAEAERANTMMEEYFGKMLTFLTIGIGQSLIVALGDKFILGVTVVDLPLFLGVSVFASIIFMLIVYSLVSILGVVGKAVCVILLVFQIAGAGGTFPVEVMPEFYQIIQPYLPFTYAIGAMREAVAGPAAESLWYDFWHLLIFGAMGLAIGMLLKKPLHPLMEWFNRKFKESGISE